MKLCTLDFETYYDADYSLSKLTTEEYVRDARFQTIGCAFSFDDADPVWVAGETAVREYIASQDWTDTVILAQNCAFDGAILAWRYGVNPLGWADTLSMSRALYPHEESHSLAAQAARMRVGVKGEEVLHAKGKRYDDFTPAELARYGAYCCNDVDLARALFQMYVAQGFPNGELRLIDLTLRMFVSPVLVLDAPYLREHLRETRTRKAELLRTVAEGVGVAVEAVKSVLMSNPRFAQALQELGVTPPRKVSPTTGKETWAFAKTDEAFKVLEDHEDSRVQALVAARVGNRSTLEETRTESLLAVAARGPLPVPLRYFGAHSGRWSGSDGLNLQNLPSRGPNANKIKKAIRAPAGHVVIDCDSAQIEARTLAWLAGQEDLVQAFREKRDVYKRMATRIYNVPEDQVTPEQRQVGKVAVLGCGYGIGAAKLRAFLKLQARVEVSDIESKRIVDAYRTASPSIVGFWRKAGDAIPYLAQERECDVDPRGVIRVVGAQRLTLPSGLHLHYPELRSVQGDDGRAEWVYTSKGAPVRLYGGKVVENICQAVARQVIAEQMLRVSKRYRVVLTVHDAIAIVAPAEEAYAAREYLEDCMRWVPVWALGLPLACESGMGESYGEC